MHRSVPLDHVFCPACDPHFPALAANKKTTILIPATSHSSPLYSEDGSSAFSCVTSECSAGVKLHDGLRAEFRPTPIFLLLESASTSQVGSPVIAPRIVCADVHRPRTKAPAATGPLPEGSEGGFAPRSCPNRVQFGGERFEMHAISPNSCGRVSVTYLVIYFRGLCSGS